MNTLASVALVLGVPVVLYLLADRALRAGTRQTSRARAALSDEQVLADLAPYQPHGRQLHVAPAERRRSG